MIIMILYPCSVFKKILVDQLTCLGCKTRMELRVATPP